MRFDDGDCYNIIMIEECGDVKSLLSQRANCKFKLNISQMGKLADKNSSKQFVWIKLASTTIFLVEVINSKEQEKRKIWSRDTNLRLPLAVNVALNREVKHHVYVKRQTRICTT